MDASTVWTIARNPLSDDLKYGQFSVIVALQS